MVTLGDYPTKVSGAIFKQKKTISGCLGMPEGKSPLDMPRTLYWVSEGKNSQQPTMSYHLTLTSSSVYHLSHHDH